MRERCDVAMEHLQSLIAFEAGVDSWEEALSLPAKEFAEAENRGVRHLRGQIPLYVKGARGAAQARERVTRCCTVREVEDVLATMREGALGAGKGYRGRVVGDADDSSHGPCACGSTW